MVSGESTRHGIRAGERRQRANSLATSPRGLTIGVLVAVAVAGIMSLPRPLGGDQALFLYMARAMHNGSVLYRDIWDAKQPGIYGFYYVAGSLFGFNEIAVHLAELMVMFTLAVVLQRTLPDFGLSHRAAALAPLAVVLPYYLVSSTWDLTQLEPLIGLPLYLGLWSSTRARASAAHQARWQFAAGALAALVTIFKIVYAPIGLVFLVLSLRRDDRVRATALWFAGVLVVWLPVFAWVAASGLVHEVWYTWISFPRTSRSQAAQPLSTLTNSARSFGRSFAPIGALGLLGLWTHRKHLERWMVLALAWVAVALVLDLTQFWWRYLYWNLSVPIALFAVLGVIALSDAARANRRVFGAWLTVVVLLGAYALAPQRERLRNALPDPTAAFRDDTARHELRALEEPVYADLDLTVALVKAPEANPGPVVVFGSPIIQLATGRTQAGKIPGFLANTLGPDEWHDFAMQIRATPPAYVFVGSVQNTSEQEFLDTRGGEVGRILAASYCEAAVVPAGRWLVQCRELLDTPTAVHRTSVGTTS